MRCHLYRKLRFPIVAIALATLLIGCGGNTSTYGSVHYGVGYYSGYDRWYGGGDVIVVNPPNGGNRPERPDRPVRPTPLPSRPVPRPAPRPMPRGRRR